MQKQFTGISERDFNHPTLGHKTEFQSGSAGVPVTGTLNLREWTLREWTIRHDVAGVDIAGVDNAAPCDKGGQCGSGQCRSGEMRVKMCNTVMTGKELMAY